MLDMPTPDTAYHENITREINCTGFEYLMKIRIGEYARSLRDISITS